MQSIENLYGIIWYLYQFLFFSLSFQVQEDAESDTTGERNMLPVVSIVGPRVHIPY